MRLSGRRAECEVLERLLAEVREGRSRALVVHGAAGVGKTALLEQLIERAADCQVVRAAGVESEMELAFAGLQQLCVPLAGGIDGLPGPQRDALAIAFGRLDGAAPDRFLVGLAVLSLLSDAAEQRPVICVIDDAQWLDDTSSQVLGFVARRLAAESVGIVFAVRAPGAEVAGLDRLEVLGLAHADARALLESALAAPLDERVRDRIVAETQGNPLALLELPRGLSPEELAGGFELSGRIEESFARRLASLPDDTRRLLLVAAAEPVGDALLMWRAAERLGIAPEAASPAVADGLLELGASVRFRHPLVRSAAYGAATPQERQGVHRALAQVTDPELDPDRRAWHRAQATPGLDEEVAAELERSAGRARARGGPAAAAAFHERAAALTPDAGLRSRRALEAVRAKRDAGAPEAALRLLAMAQAGPLDERDRAQAELLHAQLAFTRTRGGDASRMLLAAARRLEPFDAALARETYLDALGAAIFAGRLGSIHEVAAAARAAPPPAGAPTASDLLLDGLALRFTDGHAAAVTALRQAIRTLADDELLRRPWLAYFAGNDVCDADANDALTRRAVALARDAGALTVLPLALVYRAGVHMYEAELTTAATLIEEAQAICDATGGTPQQAPVMTLSAWRGHEPRVLALAERLARDGQGRGEGRAVTLSYYGQALLYNGLGRYELARDAGARACESDEFGHTVWALPELIEASARSGDTEVAAGALARIEALTLPAGTDVALGLLARSRALVTGDEHDYREAIERLAGPRVAIYLARTRLVYGEWLRRERRRVDARQQLRAAHETFSAIGADGFAERARRELVATGESIRRRTSETRDELTAQEAQIAQLAAQGRTNPEIGAELFISARTVEWHLYKVFAKLGISSRRDLPSH